LQSAEEMIFFAVYKEDSDQRRKSHFSQQRRGFSLQSTEETVISKEEDPQCSQSSLQLTKEEKETVISKGEDPHCVQ